MINFYDPGVKGTYGRFDANFLYHFILGFKPKNILELGCRHGRSNKCILDALARVATPANYYVFEKDDRPEARCVVRASAGQNTNVAILENIIDSPALDAIFDIDYLHIDGNHDYILPQWYIENLFPKVRSGGYIHIHDIYYDREDNGWEGINSADAINHKDLIDIETIKGYYSTIFDKYQDGGAVITQNEESIVRDFILNNGWDFTSTLVEARKYGVVEQDHGMMVTSCSLYIRKP